VNGDFFDADNHYYEAEDAFTRYASERMVASRFVRWLTEADGKRRRLLFGAREANVIGNPTFNPITRPGAFQETLRALQVGEDRSAAAYGTLEPIPAAYRDRDARLATMDAQGVDKAMFFPTLAVTVEGMICDDVELLYDSLHAFNRWLDDDWGFSYRERIYAVPYVSMLDVDRAVGELEWLLDRGTPAITIRPGPAYGRSPADPEFDPFWARVDEAGTLVTYHAFEGPSAYTESFRYWWARPPRPWRPEDLLLERVVANLDDMIMDTCCALVLHNLFGRFPRIRVATIEMGGGWVPYLLRRLDHAGGLVDRRIAAFGATLADKPSEIFRRHVWVAPFPEEDVAGLVEVLGAEHVLMGSDWPHAEGTRQPADYLDCLRGLDERSVRRITRENALGLVTT
jgi:predicted TIM-barrel fold metal-dependent hydrolase